MTSNPEITKPELRNIILVGFMGTGKSSIGKKLSNRLQWSYVDTDACIELNIGMSIKDYFTQKGEGSFRDIEKETLASVLSNQYQVISTGGGIVLREENIQMMKTSGIIIALSATPEIIYQRTKSRTTRPILGDNPTLSKINELLAIRAPYYAKADWTIDTSIHSKEKIVEQILDYIKSHYQVNIT